VFRTYTILCILSLPSMMSLFNLIAMLLKNGHGGKRQWIFCCSLQHRPEICRTINNYFINYNHTSYILVVSICNIKTFEKRKKNYAEMNKKILNIFPNYFEDIENIFYHDNMLFTTLPLKFVNKY